MAISVITAFSQFLADEVNLLSDDVTLARTSRDWLLGKVHDFPNQDAAFPELYDEVDIFYGSFARRTKIRELDDVDLIVGIKARGITYTSYNNQIVLHVPQDHVLIPLCHDATNHLNSRKVINKFLTLLSDVPQYEKAEIKRNGSAAVLKLTSYSWSFDIVPAFFTSKEYDGRDYYLIPDGNGYWMKTDPRIDQKRVSSINQANDGNVLNVLRLIKYWQRRPTMPTMPSYLLECIVLDYYVNKVGTTTAYVDLEFGPVLRHLGNAVLSNVPDPKKILDDLNSLSFSDRWKIYERCTFDAQRADKAREFERSNDHKDSIEAWREILGNAFPKYG